MITCQKDATHAFVCKTYPSDWRALCDEHAHSYIHVGPWSRYWHEISLEVYAARSTYEPLMEVMDS